MRHRDIQLREASIHLCGHMFLEEHSNRNTVVLWYGGGKGDGTIWSTVSDLLRESFKVSELRHGYGATLKGGCFRSFKALTTICQIHR
ncbi:hypothetical protein M408DRAFT_327347 [Serendipita vermifera MAFF 305830]|uniref:Uncharacterized protein n=1 Tax=Serendipita vermifera MAFF 305830 TaxID=933852 RepID=A0A0C3B566_SERVB|nr:hypothetical protein M408DRAFT_327347 [Serendipita vermifera MAFF 305830]